MKRRLNDAAFFLPVTCHPRVTTSHRVINSVASPHIGHAIPATLGWLTVLAAATSLTAADPPATVTANAVVNRAMEAYRAVRTYQDTYTFETIVAGSHINGEPDVQHDLIEGSLTYEKPNRIALRQPREFIIQSDGTNIWTAIPTSMQFRKQRMTGPLDLQAMLPHYLARTTMLHPVAKVLVRPDLGFKDLFPYVHRWTGVESQLRQGHPGTRVTGELLNPHMEIFGVPRAFEAWFAEADGMLRHFSVDLTPFIRELASQGIYDLPAKVDHASFSLTFNNVAINAAVNDDDFVFSPGTYDTEVEYFNPQIDLERSMVGRPAPAFKGADIEGKQVSLKDLRGRVLLLDFWSLRCGPCIVAMPSLQRIADRFADQPVSIIGVNGDPVEYRDQVKLLLEQKRIQFRQIMDAKSILHLAYFINAVPCSYLIDQEGVIRHVHLGLTRDFEQRITGMIEALLTPES